MKSISKSIFIGLLLVGFSNQGAWSAQDVVKTYHSDGRESIRFKDGASAIVTANAGTMTGGEKKVTIVPRAGSTFTLTLRDDGWDPDVMINDGTYTGIIQKISTDAMSDENLQLVNYQTADIVVDLDNGGDPGTVTIQADYKQPEILALVVSEPYFSPQSSPGQKDTTTITFKSNETGKYEILIDNRIPSSNPTGTMSANVDISYVWDGCDEYGRAFLEGTHTVQVNIWDEAGNQANIETCYVWIDRTAPMKVFISLSDDVFSPGTSTGIQDTTTIILQNDELDPISYQLSIDGRILLGGTGTIPQNYFEWVIWGGLDENGVAFDEGTHTINLSAEDPAGNSAEDTVLVTIDNTPPRIDFLIDNSGGNPCYRDQEIIFVLQSSDWIGTNSVESDGGIGICSFDARVLDLIDCGNGIYAEYYKVVQTDVGTFAYSAYFEDKAGNPAINNNEIFGTIALRGNEFPPVSGARIVRLKTLTPENGTFTINNITLATSTMTIYSNNIKTGDKIKITNNSCSWVTSASKDGEISVSNADIFFGFPVSDYNNIATSTITEGTWVKKVMKIDDEVIINLTAVNILNTLGQPTRTTTAVIFEDPRIATGTMVVVYDNNDAHIWLGTASQSGRFEASNANIYFGKLVNDYQGLGEIKGIIASFAMGGAAYTDMGLIVQGISLYDNGAVTHKDVIAGDGVYSNLYTIKQKDDTTSYFYGYFSSAGNNAENNGIRSQEEIVIDATPPVITNFGAFPGIFRPGSENVTIKYTLLEIGSKVTIEIWKDNDRIRILTIPEPQYGDNCSATWDGKNLCGGLVKDGDYTFKINAVDTAGNKATERIGAIKASTINITITELKIDETEFTPTPQIEDDTDFWTNIHVTVEATKSQLENLGFEMDSEDIYTLPYLLVDFTCFDAQGNELRPLGLPDLNTGDSDDDPFTNGYPNYYTGPFGTETGWGWYPKLGTDLPDEGDGNKGNDWNTLVPLQRDPLDENQYYIDWGVGIKDWNIPNGTYIIRMQVELVGSCWKFIDYVRDPAENPIAEKWHQKPNHAKGYSRTSESVEGRVEVIHSPIIKPDYIAPVIVMTDPGANTIHEPTENISVISAQLMDQGGAGIDFGLSTIILKNSIGLVMPGVPSNNGIDTVKWTLETPLTLPDDYTIEVKPVDNAKNGADDTPQIFTFTILDRMGPEIFDILVDSTVLKDKDIFGPNVIQKITVTLSEIETGKSKVDFASSKIIVKKQSTGEEDEPNKLFGGSRREEKINETENSGRIIYENLTIDEGGTYTIWVEAWDKTPSGNNSYSPKLTFYVSVEGYIYVYFNYPGLGTKTYLEIPPDTKADTYATSGVTVSTNTISIKQGTITPNEGYTAIDPAIEFWWFNTEHTDITLDPPVGNISLTMYYGHKLPLPIGITEDNLAIWRYNGTMWEKISGVNDIDKNNNKITVNLPEYPDVSLEDSYAIMYSTPKAVEVQYYHYQYKKWVTCLKIPESTTVNGSPVGTDTVTAGTSTTTRTGYVVVKPVVQFFLKDTPDVKTMVFNNEVELIMYYTQDDVKDLSQRSLTEADLAIYEYDGTNWAKITTAHLDQDNKQMTYKTKIIRKMYAIMYVIPEITEKPETFKESVFAYPNPTKGGRVTFRYDLIRDAKVTLKIYTIMGDEVWTKEYSSASPQGKQGSHGVYPAGNDAIFWNCENNAGKKVATGLYIYRLTAADESGEVTVTKKLIVVQ